MAMIANCTAPRPSIQGSGSFPRGVLAQLQGRRSTIFTGSLGGPVDDHRGEGASNPQGQKPQFRFLSSLLSGSRSIDAIAPGLSFFNSPNGIDFLDHEVSDCLEIGVNTSAARQRLGLHSGAEKGPVADFEGRVGRQDRADELRPAQRKTAGISRSGPVRVGKARCRNAHQLGTCL